MIIKISNITIQVNSIIKHANFDLFQTEEIPLYIIDSGISSLLIHQRYEKDQLMYELFFDGVNQYTYLIHCKDQNRYDEIEFVASLDLISYILLKNKHFILHASAFIYENNAILLSGKSGVGKTTLSSRFSKEESFTWINDDKPVLHMIDDRPYASSSPWMGKDRLGLNTKALVKSVYFLEQGKDNEIIELTTIEKIILFREHLVWSSAKNDVDDILLFIELIIDKVNIYKMKCTNSLEAFYMLKNHFQKTNQ